MPAYDLAARDRFARGIDMPGMDLADSTWTVSLHDRPHLKAHKHLPRRRDHSLPSVDLRSHYKQTQPQLPNGDIHDSQRISTTPPHPAGIISPDLSTSPVALHEPSEQGRDDSSNAETTILRSRVATPTYQDTPPTPDVTPPRPENNLLPSHPFLANAPSRAESFKTAREELSSDEEIDHGSPSQASSRQRWLQTIHAARMADWGVRPSPLVQPDEDNVTPTKSIKRKQLPVEALAAFESSWHATDEDHASSVKLATSLNSTMGSASHGRSLRPINSQPSPLPTPPRSADIEERQASPESPPPQRGKSLRDRLEEAKMVKARDSTEKFARDIGWSHVYKSPDLQNRINSWRFSGVSTTSTVEAIVVDADSPPPRQQLLRHSRKNPSLRSTSSPFPASNRSSLLSNPESPHRLVHKKGKITNKTRWSMTSEASRTMSVSLAVENPPKPDVIHVAVIPERKSSLQSSENSSRRHSVPQSMSSAGHHAITSPDRPNKEPHMPLRKRRPMSACLPVGASFDSQERDRQPPTGIPLRRSPFSAPTSRNNSRANSLTSEHFRLRRLAAEEDLHRTLERMESERSVAPRYSASHTREGSNTHPAEPDSEQVDVVRPQSQYTPFSQPSMDSASPGPVEMGEARAVNLFSHNNHSLQIVDQFPQPESRAVQFLQRSGGKGRLPADEPSTPTQTPPPQLIFDSLLRNPRDPPPPPALKVIPPTPADLTPVEDTGRQLGLPSPGMHRKRGSLSRRFGSLKRPTLKARHHSESFVKSLSRTLSLRNTRNIKADEPLDANLHPFWRPRGFWDDITDSESDQDDYDDDEIVSNSLGVPQQRTIIDGPISLVRHFSDSARRRGRARGVAKRTSYGSLSRLRVGRRVYRIPGLAHRFTFVRFRDLQHRLQLSKWRREDEKRERSRQALREKIGHHVIPTGDSRYPAHMTLADLSTYRQGGIMDGRAGFSSREL